MAWTVNGASTRARELVAVFQILCSLYGLTCVGYAQKPLEFISRSPLINVVGRSFCLHTDSLFAQIGPTTNALPRWRLNVETKTKRTLYSSLRLSFNELTNAKNLGLHSSHFALNWRCCTALGERSSGGIWKFRASSFRFYVDHSHTMYSSGNTDVRNWVQKNKCTLIKYFIMCRYSTCYAAFFRVSLYYKQYTNNRTKWIISWRQKAFNILTVTSGGFSCAFCAISCIFFVFLCDTLIMVAEGQRYVMEHILVMYIYRFATQYKYYFM